MLPNANEIDLPRVLVVDDQLENRLLITDYLNELDIAIDEARSGKECLEKLRNKPYTMVILDIQMPDMNGFEVLEEMRRDESLKEVPVIFVSAIYDSDKYILKGIESGAIDFMTKPINISILRSKVSNFLKLYDKQNKLDQLVKTLESMNLLLQENEKKIKKITQSANDSIIVLDANYNITFWNRASREIFGYVKYEIISENFFDKLISAKSHDVLRDYFFSLLDSSKSSLINTIRISGINKHGLEFPIELSLSYFITAANEINYTVIIRDITHRLNIEREALKSKELHESNKIMREFMDNVSHELRTPMNAILGISNMLLKYNSDNLLPKQIEGIQIINQSGTRLLDLINDVLDLSKLEANKVNIEKEKFDIEKLLAYLRSMVFSLIGNRKIKFHIRKSSNVPDYLFSDLKKLNQILINLLGNAVKFTQEGKIHLFIHIIQDKLYFEVSDTGVGISKENLTIIFEKFRQIDNSASKEFKGTGLGLNICKKLIEILGGEIEAASTPGIGTTMKFYIPLIKDELQRVAPVKTEESTSDLIAQGRTISALDSPLAVIIEFNEDNNFWYSNLLKENGYETVSCFNSSTGLKALKRYLPDLVILRMEMPRIHGQFLLNQIGTSDNLKRIPILVVTSVQDLSLIKCNNPIILLHEPISEELLLSNLKKVQQMPKNTYKTNKLIFYEKVNHLEDYITNKDECFENKSEESARIILSRRKIKYLFFDGIEINGENNKLIKWLQTNQQFLPKKIIGITSNLTYKSALEELKKLPEYKIIKIQTILENKSIEKAIK